MKKSVLMLLLAVVVLSSSAMADRRNYVWTYQYMTMPEGKTELEFYQTTKLNVLDSWEYRFEVEHGFTDRWDFSVYQIFFQPENGNFSWSSVQFRTRYRFGEEGQYLMDPLLYFEYNRKLDLKERNKVEAKLILAKTIEKWNVSINPLYELFFAPGQKHELGIDVGMSYQFHPKFIAGTEFVFRYESEDDETETAAYFGPTLSFASGHWWYSIGLIFGLTDDSDDARVRFLMGVGI